MKQLVSSGYPFETEYGYSRAVRAGDTVYVSGTTARGDDLGKGVYEQARSIIATISDALTEAGAGLDDVVRTVVYVRDLDNVTEITKAHAEAFSTAKPASTLIEVSRLTPAEALVEIEVTAHLTG
jgi:enamine deaminase RidA (YjgF/YER057c/UK114 family)